jgi:pyridoxine/pyridoxamine 5'-phosphate oxidase
MDAMNHKIFLLWKQQQKKMTVSTAGELAKIQNNEKALYWKSRKE